MSIDMDSILNGATEIKGMIPPEVLAEQIKTQCNVQEGETISLLGDEDVQRVREEGCKDPRYIEGKKNLEKFKEQGVKISYTEKKEAIAVEEPTTKGFVIEKKEEAPKERPHEGQLSPDIEEKIDKREAELDQDIIRAKKNLEDLLGRELAPGEMPSEEELAAAKRRRAEGLAPKAYDEEDDEDIRQQEEEEAAEAEKKYKEAVVIIDKSGMGDIINFTDEEKAKLEKVNVIKLKEVEYREMPVVKTKKVRNKSVKQILTKTIAPYTTNIVAPIAGFTATMSACSAYELIELLTAEQLYDTSAAGLEAKWQIIYNHVESTSIGKMSFDQFLHSVSSLDYKSFVFGILASTYGSREQTMNITCFRHCGPLDKKGKPTDFTHDLTFNIKELLRPERFSELLTNLFTGAVDNALTKEDAIKFRDENSPVVLTKNIYDETTGAWFQLQIPSVHDLIEKIYPKLEQLAHDQEKIQGQLGILASNVRKILVPDIEADDGSFYELTSMSEIIDCLYTLPKVSFETVSLQIEGLTDGLEMDYGFMNVRCPNCGHVTPFVPVDLDAMLFILAEQERSTIVEK